MSAVAQFERERIAERIADVKASQKDKGHLLGGQRAPYGFRVGEHGELVEDASEQALVARMRAMRAEGMSYRKIAAEMAGDDGAPTHPEMIKRALNSKR